MGLLSILYYFIIFILCLSLDNISIENKGIRYFLIFVLYTFLCFGYMTGSDWRDYELFFYGSSIFDSQYIEKEWLFVYLIHFLSKIIPDFWLVSGMLKILLLHSILCFFSVFTKQKYFALAITYSMGSLLFLIISYPMRFACTLTLIFYAIYIFYKYNNRIIPIILLGLSPFFHKAVLVVVLILLTFPLNKYFYRINRWILYGMYVFILVISSNVVVYDFIYNSVLPFLSLDSYTEWYALKENETIPFLGTFVRLFFFAIILYHKNIILNTKNGKVIYYFTCLSYLIEPFYWFIPTAFRINILFSMFATVSIAYILVKNIHVKNQFYLRSVCLLLMSIILLKSIYTSYAYIPYSNSIPYILTGNHLDYNYRSNYNIIEYEKRIGQQ